METMEHLFLTAPIAKKLWKQFVCFASIQIKGMHLQQFIYSCWDFQGPNSLGKSRRPFQPLATMEET